MDALDELATILRPPGAGLYLVSTGKAAQLALQQRLSGRTTEAEIAAAHRRALEEVVSAKGVLLGVPSDVGAGYRRGANLGPHALRVRLLDDDARYSEWCRELGLVDVGDVFVVPQLLHDSMLSEAQLDASRRALYPKVAVAEREQLPVSPLSIAERAWNLLWTLNPRAKPFVLGGDHSATWPVVSALGARGALGAAAERGASAARGAGAVAGGGDAAGTPVAAPTWGIVQLDAHTDLLEERLGVRYCFATWSWHANELVGRHGRLTQVGIRASGRDRAHWESKLGVRQFWAAEVNAAPEAALEAIVTHVRGTGVRGVYLSNDIDGTDAQWADATGTPEPGGLTPEWVEALIARLGVDVGILGGDVMEVAPSLSASPEKTLGVGARYFRATVEAALRR
jgi:agmatinase